MPPYARYIPPPKSKEPEPSTLAQPKKIVFGEADISAPTATNGTQQIDDQVAGRIEGNQAKRANPIADISDPVESPAKRRKKSRAEILEEEPPLSEPKQLASKKRKSKGENRETANIQQDVYEENAAGRKSESPVDRALQPDQEPKKEKKKDKRKKKLKEGASEADAAGADGDDVRKRHKSVFEKIGKALQASSAVEAGEGDSDKETLEPEEVHGLEPLPQPAPAVFDASKLNYETLPPWLASPVRVTADMRRPFSELGISQESTKVLESKGFKDAFAVQTTVLPLLFPSADRQGDVVVAAPTGSGKTMAYALPMIRDISQAQTTKLRGIIVLPTRDLVQQVQAACDVCVPAFAIGRGKRVKVGTAMGNRAFKEEQSTIMEQEQRYDPQGYERYLVKQRQYVSLDDSDTEEDDLGLGSSKPLPYHVVTHASKVDILICTPGRLVEHINKTSGFTLDYVRWLVVDEADKLLAQDFQQWLNTVMEKLSVERPGARDFPGSNKSGVRKVILSATMTRDLSLLNGLKLSRPRLIVLEGAKAGEHTLPSLLRESVIKVHELSLKPLYLVDLLDSGRLVASSPDAAAVAKPTESQQDAESASSSDETSDSDSSSSSDEDSDSSSSISSSSASSEGGDKARSAKTTRTLLAKGKNSNASVLVFTKSNEAALRLSRLLAILVPDLGPLIGTLTSTTKTSKRAQTLRAFSQGKLQILVASDLVSRGIDLLNLDHVVNYDVPINETSYIHRVGRTARAGRAGHAWTFVEHAEARWFWREFAGEGKDATTSIVRSGKIERVRVSGSDKDGGKFSEERIKHYEAALEQLRQEAGE
ncbi:P-loop containing nucleoside triphosphate hydrolase protein [Lasiosphaeria miniovina]|uniref:ATP-dependent RNA helicase n=1 Tax=Lasiosphaeria miniovina TaxID=1954250 RepID=A0AA39ZYQ2_9PEZI|nr:P-loop containing nucleoside triphosphate hydrolase protein [Lasiosphaeria miniovina]KAK0706050.1 P-loop containing nucleoside triphosphate hydrolase protein [Lasiosphaeria miniovina]